jgi:hypothetical protein
MPEGIISKSQDSGGRIILAIELNYNFKVKTWEARYIIDTNGEGVDSVSEVVCDERADVKDVAGETDVVKDAEDVVSGETGGIDERADVKDVAGETDGVNNMINANEHNNTDKVDNNDKSCDSCKIIPDKVDNNNYQKKDIIKVNSLNEGNNVINLHVEYNSLKEHNFYVEALLKIYYENLFKSTINFNRHAMIMAPFFNKLMLDNFFDLTSEEIVKLNILINKSIIGGFNIDIEEYDATINSDTDK